MLNLTSELGPRVAEYNTRHNRNNPERRIRLLAKAEYLNEASNSHKDRIARAIIREAAGRGELSRKDGGKKTSEPRVITCVTCIWYSLCSMYWLVLQQIMLGEV